MAIRAARASCFRSGALLGWRQGSSPGGLHRLDDPQDRQAMIARAVRTLIARIGRTAFQALAASGVKPNQITLAGFALVLVSCALYLWTKDLFVLGVALSLSYPIDAIDGAVARYSGSVSRFGGYLDSVVDRYQEVAGYFVVGVVTGWWIGIFALTVGSLLVSYNKAAAALQVPIDNKGWPDLMERARRTWLFCPALILDNAIPIPEFLGGSFAHLAIWSIAVLVHFTAIQRIMRARRLLVTSNQAVSV
jgi:archaetidylinositol phosphate synthase